jgi:hypothetical protein
VTLPASLYWTRSATLIPSASWDSSEQQSCQRAGASETVRRLRDCVLDGRTLWLRAVYGAGTTSTGTSL